MRKLIWLLLLSTVSAQTVTDYTLVWNGIQRYYRVRTPAVYSTSPVLVIFAAGAINDPKATCSTISGIQVCTDPADKCAANGFIYPCGPSLQNGNTLARLSDKLGYPVIWADPSFCENHIDKQWLWDAPGPNFFTACSFPPDDSGFLRQMITNVRSGLPSLSGIVLIGFSTGGIYAYQAMSDLPDVISGFVIAEGAMCAGCALLPPLSLPVNVYQFHGRNDPTLAYGGCDSNCVIAWGSLGHFPITDKDADFNYVTDSFSCTNISTSENIVSTVPVSVDIAGNVSCFEDCLVQTGQRVTINDSDSSILNTGSPYQVAAVVDSRHFLLVGASAGNGGVVKFPNLDVLSKTASGCVGDATVQFQSVNAGHTLPTLAEQITAVEAVK